MEIADSPTQIQLRSGDNGQTQADQIAVGVIFIRAMERLQEFKYKPVNVT